MDQMRITVFDSDLNVAWTVARVHINRTLPHLDVAVQEETLVPNRASAYPNKDFLFALISA